jgi:cellulose synthase/poly-beta-1,6-N-acetylglucosamine synthase-like glycosyltransferase
MEIAWKVISTFLGYALLIITLPGTIELFLLTIGALLPKKNRTFFGSNKKKSVNLKTAVLIPAHNEELHLSKTLESLQHCSGEFEIVVIADNCSDQTATIAREHHVRVIERQNKSLLGKPYALQYAFSILLLEDVEIFTIVDADTIVHPNLIEMIQQAFQNGALAVQSRCILTEKMITPLQRLSRIAFSASNVVRPLGRERWGFSAGLLGNGFAISRIILLKVPFEVNSIVEDAAYHIKIVEAGYRVHYIDQSEIETIHPPSTAASITQKSRWEGGRWRLLRDRGMDLFKKILHGKYRLVEPLLDLLLLPLSFYVLCLIFLLFIPNLLLRSYALIGIGVLTLHLFATLKLTGGGWKDIQALCLAPYYSLWKLTFLSKIVKAAKKNVKWTRTERK